MQCCKRSPTFQPNCGILDQHFASCMRKQWMIWGLFLQTWSLVPVCLFGNRARRKEREGSQNSVIEKCFTNDSWLIFFFLFIFLFRVHVLFRFFSHFLTFVSCLFFTLRTLFGALRYTQMAVLLLGTKCTVVMYCNKIACHGSVPKEIIHR